IRNFLVYEVELTKKFLEIFKEAPAHGSYGKHNEKEPNSRGG
ncbi:2432_t:CDS:1, partial [Paraglomus brasilianum]